MSRNITLKPCSKQIPLKSCFKTVKDTGKRNFMELKVRMVESSIWTDRGTFLATHHHTLLEFYR